MAWAFFLGCTVPLRNLNYELSVRGTAEKLGIELQDLEEFGCCGFPLKSLSVDEALVVAARNLALASKAGLDVVTACSACAATLAEAAETLAHDPARADMVASELSKIGLELPGPVKVRHYARVLFEEIGVEAIKEKVVKPLTGFRFAPHYGCHYLKPGRVMDYFDQPDDPKSLSALIEATGAEAVDYPELKDCCGGGVLGQDEELAQQMAYGKLHRLDQMGVTGLVVICPFCNVMFEGQQKSVAKRFGEKLKVPMLFYTQILGLALGLSQDDLGFKLNRIKNKEMLAALA